MFSHGKNFFFRTLLGCALTGVVASFCAAGTDRGIAIRPSSPDGKVVTGDQWLLVIGIDAYLHWPRLQTAVNDAKAVRGALLSRYHFDKEHVIELLDERATRRNIIAALRRLAGELKEDDQLVVFYAGHGHLDSITKEGSWIPVESGVKDASAWLSNHDIKNYLRVDAIKAKHILLVSDSCFSGDFFRGHRGKLPEPTDEVVKRAYKLASRQAVTSGGLEPVTDAGFGNNSVFSHFLVKALKDNDKPFLVASALFPQIRAGVAENAEQFPRFGSLKGTGGQQGGELVLFLRGGLRGKALSAKRKELERLKSKERELAAERDKERAAIEKQERELADLDSKIKDMKSRLGTSAARANDSLDAMLAMVRRKEAQQKKLDELNRKREEEEARRQAELARLKAQKKAKRAAALMEDIAKYREIVSSPHGRDMKEAAWKSLLANYPELQAKDIKTGDMRALLLNTKYSDVAHRFTNSVGMTFVLIPEGSFVMGSAELAKKYPKYMPHKVTLTKPFYMQTTEVTTGQWRKVIKKEGRGHSKCTYSDCPQGWVSWDQVTDFARKLRAMEKTPYRLPTEAEWEYACRAGTTGRHFLGEKGDLKDYGWLDDNSERRPHSVQTKPPNPWGLYDIFGNLAEWVQDVPDDYPETPQIDPLVTDSKRWSEWRAKRGSEYRNARANYIRCAQRGKLPKENNMNPTGVRLAADLTENGPKKSPLPALPTEGGSWEY